MDDYEYGKLYIVSLAYTQVKLGIDYKEFRDKAFSIFNNLLESGLKELMELDKVKEIKKALSKKKIPKFNLKKSVLSTIKIGNIYAFKMYPKEYNKVTPNHYLFDKYVIFKVIAFSLSKEPVIVMYNKFYDSIPSFDDVKENDDILLHNVIYRKKPYGPFYTIYGIAPEMVCITGYEESFWLDELLLIGNHPANEKYNELYKTENSYWKVHRDPNIYWIRNDGFGKVYILCFEEAKLKGNLDLENSRIQETISEELKRFNFPKSISAICVHTASKKCLS